MPRRASVVGKVGSLHKVGVSWLKGLKFCSAATKSLAAFRASAPFPKVAMMLSPV